MTVPVLIVSHGGLARELLASADAISGQRPDSRSAPIHALCIDWRADGEQTVALIEARIRELDREHGAGVLILTEMFGNTPCNSALRAAGAARAAVVTGVNLPMVLGLRCGAPDLELPDLADWAWSSGRRSIQLAAPGLTRPAE